MWFDNVKAVQVNAKNVDRVAKWIGARTIITYGANSERVKQIVAETPRGDVMICQGDWVGVDASSRSTKTNRFRVIRIALVDLDEMLGDDENATVVKMVKKAPKPGPRR